MFADPQKTSRKSVDQSKEWKKHFQSFKQVEAGSGANYSGIDVNAQDNYGWTALHEACNHGHIECVRELLKFVPSKSPSVAQYFSKGYKVSRVDFFACNVDGITPLHDAVTNNHVEVAQMLLQRGGTRLLSAVTTDGLKPLDLAPTEEMRMALTSFLPVQRHKSDSQESYTSSQETYSGVDGVSLDMPSDTLYEEVLHSDGMQAYADRQSLAHYIHLVSSLVHNYIIAVGLDSYKDGKKQPQGLVKVKQRQPSSCVSCSKTNCSDCYSTDKENIPTDEPKTFTSMINSLDNLENSTNSISETVNSADFEDRKLHRKDVKLFKHFAKYLHRFETHLLRICNNDDKGFVASELLDLQLII